ncbi:hypothetical protein FVEN_g13193 [Fusarium venenatum]|nr:hypothetical protein FVEN_g13193 [Fusarium venenatum]
MPLQGVLQLLQNISWTLLLTVTACQKEPREQRKLQLYELLLNKLVLQQKKIPENAVDLTINPET